MTLTAKQFHRAYRKYANGEGIKFPKSFRVWCKKQTIHVGGQPITGADWLRTKDAK